MPGEARIVAEMRFVDLSLFVMIVVLNIVRVLAQQPVSRPASESISMALPMSMPVSMPMSTPIPTSLPMPIPTTAPTVLTPFSAPASKSVSSTQGDIIITTIAGTGSTTYSGDNGAATSATLYYPRGVALDASGRIL